MSAPHESQEPRGPNRVLEANLRALLQRAYRPVLSSPAFRSRLTQLVAARAVQLAAAQAAGRQREVAFAFFRGPRAILAAAAILCATGIAFLAWALAGSGEELRGILERGAVAVRAEERGAWDARTPEEARAGFVLRDAFLEVATPERSAALVVAPEGRLALASSSHARVARAGSNSLDLELLAGRASWHGEGGERELEAPVRWRVETHAGSSSAEIVRAEPGAASVEGPPSAAPSSREPRGSGVMFRGRVVSARSGESIPSFTLSYQDVGRNDGIEVPRKAITGAADGRFEIDPPTAQKLALHVQAEGHAMRTIEISWPAEDAAEERLIELERGGTVHGKVIDATTGEPLANAIVFSEIDSPERDVSMHERELPRDLRTARTNADGIFELAPLSTGRQLLRAMHPERAPGWCESFELAPGLPQECGAIELGPGGSIAGSVLRRNGEPWAESWVLALRFDFSAEHRCSLYDGRVSDASGAFTFARLPAGNYLLMHFGGIPTDEDSRPVDMIQVRVDVGAVTQARLGAPAGAGALRGVLLDADGQPLSGWTLSFVEGDGPAAQSWPMAACDDAGRFALPEAKPATYYAYATHDEGRTLVHCGTIEHRAGEERVHELRLGRSAFAGVVTRSDSVPLGDALVVLEQRAPDGSSNFVGKAEADPSGRYELEHLQPGEYRVIAYDAKQGHGQESSGWTSLLPGERRELDFKLWPGGEIEIEVVDGAGEPVPRAQVNLKNGEGSAIPFAPFQQTDPRGRFLARGCTAGTWTAVARKEGYALSAPRSVEVRIGERASVRLVLTPR